MIEQRAGHVRSWRHFEADGLPLSVEERSCSGHRPMTGFDPQRTNAAAMQQFFGTSAALSGSVLCAGVSVARAT